MAPHRKITGSFRGKLPIIFGIFVRYIIYKMSADGRLDPWRAAVKTERFKVLLIVLVLELHKMLTDDASPDIFDAQGSFTMPL